jgi:SAM-dependent methyltransferase
MDENEIREAISRYKFYHIIPLTDAIATPGNMSYVPAQNLCMKHLKSLNLKGKRVLDIGCRDGLFSFAAESMGAEEVIGIDNDLSKPATEFLIPYFQSRIKLMQMNLYDLKPDTFGLFDVVIFPGVLYHLRYPFWGLKAIRDVLNVGGHLITETPIWEGEPNNAMLFCPIGEESPYEPTSCTFFNEKGLVDTLTSIGFETVAIECLRQEEQPAEVVDPMKPRPPIRIVTRCVEYLRQEEQPAEVVDPMKPRPPIRIVTRCVFHSIFRGCSRDAFTMKYWEETHNFHTEHGG